MLTKASRRLSLGGFGAFERSGMILLNDLAADIAEVSFKTDPTTPHQTGGERHSKTKGVHKTQALITDIRPLG